MLAAIGKDGGEREWEGMKEWNCEERDVGRGLWGKTDPLRRRRGPVDD